MDSPSCRKSRIDAKTNVIAHGAIGGQSAQGLFGTCACSLLRCDDDATQAGLHEIEMRLADGDGFPIILLERFTACNYKVGAKAVHRHRCFQPCVKVVQ